MSKRDDRDYKIQRLAMDMDFPLMKLLGFSEAVTLIANGCRHGCQDPADALYEIGKVLEHEAKQLREMQIKLIFSIRGDSHPLSVVKEARRAT